MSGEKLGSWVSEQLVGFSKIMLWWIPLVDCAKEDSYEVPSGSQKNWKKGHNVDWLEMRDLNADGNADTVRGRVACYMAQDGGSPEIVQRRLGGSGVIHNLAKSLYCVVSLAMSEEVNQQLVNELQFVVKHFMTDFELLDLVLRPKRSKPRWVTTYNVAGLPNIITAMWLIGPLRNYWEGSYRGEAYLWLLKPIVSMGLRKNWQQNTLKRMLKRRSLAQLLKDEEMDWTKIDAEDVEEDQHGDEQEGNQEWSEVEKSDYREYNSWEEVNQFLEQYRCLSGVVTGNGDLKIVIRGRTEWISVEVAATEENVQENVLDYSCILLQHEYELAIMENITHGVLLLPHIQTRLNDKQGIYRWYAFVRSDWTTWNGSKFASIEL